MSFEEYAKIEHETPYVYELKKGDKELAYFGAEHSNDISNPQFERLQKKFEEIKPDIVFVEGIDWLDERKDFARTRIEETSIEDLTTGLGEPGYALKLAVDAGADFSSPEPKYQNEITALIEKGFSKDEVFTFYIYRQIEQYYRSQITNKPIEEYLKEYLDEIETKTKWEHFDYSLNHLEEVGRQVWGEKADIHNPEYAPQRITPTPGEYGDDMQTVIMKVAQESNQFRNAYMIEKIKEALKTHKKLFVVYGASHGVMQEKAIRKIFDEIA